MREPIFHAGPAICFTLMTAFIVGLSWGLGWLQRHMAFESYMIFAVVTFAIMVACGFAVDRLKGRI
jgi:uncharacterized membrane protein YphA (DoxX/SURF4 family)